jgi:hypothetical protein
MIDWLSLFTNLIWIFSLAAVLAISSQALWQAVIRKEKWASMLAESPRSEGLLSAIFLFSVGSLASAQEKWLKASWGLIGMLTLIVLLGAVFSSRKT